MLNRTENIELTIKAELECVVQDAKRVIEMKTANAETVENFLLLIESHLSVIRGELDYKNCIGGQVSISKESV